MQNRFVRPFVFPQRFVSPLVHRRRSVLEGLGDLGDSIAGAKAVPELVNAMKAATVDKAGVSVPGAFDAGAPLATSINMAVAYWRLGTRGQLQAAQQAAWNKWAAQAKPETSDTNIYWVFGDCLDRWADDLVSAATAQQNSGVLMDPKASDARYTLMDTTQSGTTWYGGTAVTSKLSNPQWAEVFRAGFDALAKGITGGVLPFTYLDVLCKGMLAAPVARRFPAWAPPGGVAITDPAAIAFRAAMKQYGWSDVTAKWFAYTKQAWVASNDAYEAQDQDLAAVITGLNYVSGKALWGSVVEKVQDYMKVRADATAAFHDFEVMRTGPLKASVSAADVAAMDVIKAQFREIDGKASDALEPIGLWSVSNQAGLGVAQYVVGGVILIALAGMLVWIISIMTAVSRSAAAQTKATADSILATVSDYKASCMRAYEASGKTPSDEAALQDCLNKTEVLYKTIPKPPDGGDPLGLKYIAIIGIVAIGGFLAYKQFGKR